MKPRPWESGVLGRCGCQRHLHDSGTTITAIARDLNLRGWDPEGLQVANNTKQGSQRNNVRCVIVAQLNEEQLHPEAALRSSHDSGAR
jgi:hypothetical protein